MNQVLAEDQYLTLTPCLQLSKEKWGQIRSFNTIQDYKDLFFTSSMKRHKFHEVEQQMLAKQFCEMETART